MCFSCFFVFFFVFCFCLITMLNYTRIQRDFYIFQDVLFRITFEAHTQVNNSLCNVPCHYQCINIVFRWHIWTWWWQSGLCVDVLKNKITQTVLPFGTETISSAPAMKEKWLGGGGNRKAFKCSHETSQAERNYEKEEWNRFRSQNRILPLIKQNSAWISL